MVKRKGTTASESSAKSRTAAKKDPSTLDLYRKERVTKIRLQNKKLKVEVEKLVGQAGDLEKMRREVLAANATVKRQVLSIPAKEATRLGLSREQIEGLTQALTQALNDLAYERTNDRAA